MRNSKRQTCVTEELEPVKNERKGTLEGYLRSCPNESEMYSFPDDPNGAYNFGKKLRQQAMEEEGVSQEHEMKKFKIDISYDFVRISFFTASNDE